MAAGVDQQVAWGVELALPSMTRNGGDGNVDVLAASRSAQRALEPFLTQPSIVLDPSCTSTSVDVNAGLTSTNVYLVDSPYNGRRSTIAFVPYDKPAAGDERHKSSEDTGDGTTAMDTDVLIQPDRLPLEAVNGMLGESGESGPTASLLGDAQSHRRMIARVSASPYSRLSYIMDESCTPFTALLATLRAAGFTRISGRAALLHKTHSLLWVKHLLPSMVDHLLGSQSGAYRKVNHFPGTHALGRKDKLCRLLRRAELRWQASGEVSTAPGDACTASTVVSRAAEWASLTPESWLLPQEAEACARAIRQPCPSAAGAPLFIVKPTNQAGGQGIFIICGGSEAGVASLTASVGGLGGIHRSNSREQSITAPSAALSKSSPDSAPPRRTCTGSFSSGSALTAAITDASDAETGRSHYVVQRYIANPFLLQGRKFDLRLYVVATSYDPVRLYLYREGLVRIASSPYTRTVSTASAAVTAATGLADVSDLKAHLTNFTLNKGAVPVPAADDAAVNAQDTKWPLSSLEAYVGAMGYDWPGTLQRIHELLRLVFLSVTPEVRAALRSSLARRLRTADIKAAQSSPSSPSVSSHATINGTSPFFEIFGVDVLLVNDGSGDNLPHDSPAASASASTLRPVLLEVNIMPSLSTHYSLLDQRIKANFIADTLTLVGLMPPPSKAASSASGTQDVAGGPGSGYDDAFLDGLHDNEILSVCLATEEERRRAGNFTRLLPTRDSASKYRALMEVSGGEGTSTPTPTPSRLDAVLSAWLASSG
ncbi:tubulin-tyrosine ligase, putative [Leishmania tarentolae]|uniref:Tubulin--tyrosine ligase-like protein 5 n=1 Tax=Leishmania tarentolae TaxID=5689 RepID=A0A640KFR1_LEITA|nr:tubulin-tyrosine ligase, putative [Leishmania tarentolae]